MGLFGFTETETLLFLGIVAVIIFILISEYRRGFYGIFSPIAVIAVIYSYYCVLGPYKGITTGETFDRLLNMRPFYPAALTGALISLLSILVGYRLNNIRGSTYVSNRDVDDELLSYYGKRVFIVSIVLYTIVTKGNIVGQLNPLDADGIEKMQGGFANYLNLSINFLIPGVALLTTYYARTRRGLWWAIIPFVIAFGLYTTMAFRYRLVLLIGAVVFSYFLSLQKRPRLVFIVAGVFGFIVFMGIINMTRQYGRGLDLDRLEGGTEMYYSKGLEEARIFQTSGAVIDMVPERHPYAGLQPIISTLLFPIPRAFYPEKASAEYLFDTIHAIYGGFGRGAACMMYAEYYLMFGWPSLIIGCFLIGWFSRKLWNWYLANWRNPLVVVAYSVTVVYLYMVISRGYLPQVVMLFFFSAFPIYVVVRLAKKKIAYKPRRKRITSHAA